jgi:hypothetical protein
MTTNSQAWDGNASRFRIRTQVNNGNCASIHSKSEPDKSTYKKLCRFDPPSSTLTFNKVLFDLLFS